MATLNNFPISIIFIKGYFKVVIDKLNFGFSKSWVATIK
jgi:hypothetical protein